MDTYIRLVDAVTEFEADFNGTPSSDHSKFSLRIQQEELKAMWEKAKAAYDHLLSTETPSPKDLAAIKKRNKICYHTYLRGMSTMADLSARLEKADREGEELAVRELNIHLPPCDTDIFKGDYVSWPTFRDMFTAIYILNKRLTPVEKLFHLNQKTQGEARDIVRKCPLTNDGFATAWKNLCERYENKRILVNTQLKILFNLQTIETECGSSIKKLQRDINNCISSLQNHQIDISNWDAIITYLCSTKLPESTLSLWEQTIENKSEISKWTDMDKFLSNRFQTLETVSGLKGIKAYKAPKAPSLQHHTETTPKRMGNFQVSVAKHMCKLCVTDDHKLQSCPKFRKLKVTDRIACVKSNNCCLNCLSSGHTVSRCTSSYNCSTCHSRHNTLLHITAVQPKAAALKESRDPADDLPSTSKEALKRLDSNRPKDSRINNFKSCYSNTDKGVLLGTAMVNIFHNNVNFAARALIDSGSECSFITERLKRRINLPSKRLHAQVSGINNSISAQVRQACSLQLRSPIDPFVKINTIALVLPQLTGNLPTCLVSAMTRQAFPDLTLADKRFFVNEPVDLVLGGDIYPQIILSGLKKNVLSTLLAQETVFGWILTGRAETVNPPKTKIVSLFSEVTLDKQLAAFWELEDIPRKERQTEDDVYCEELYRTTTKRNQDGKYVVTLPFKRDFPSTIKLGPSLKSACSQFFRNETRLAKNPSLQKEYTRVVAEYETLGHMDKITTNIPADATDHYFLPHHAVMKEESTSTKVRVVFNASCPTANGMSLNDVLHPGPVLQADMTVLILRWRLYKYVFNSDIEKMYRQIMVSNTHTKYQRIVFRTCPKDPISLYELKTVTFGINCAPYLAIRTLLQLADGVENCFSTASNILRKCVHVDLA